MGTVESRKKIANLAFYKFVRIDSPEGLKAHLREKCIDLGLKGTILLADEGINGMLAGPSAAIDAFREFLETHEPFRDIRPHLSFSTRVPFKRLLVKVKKEILTLRDSRANPLFGAAPSIDPEEMEREIKAGEAILIDVRNDFEVREGTFAGAVNPKMKSFRDFAHFAKNLSIDKRKKIITFCTGGIRCEKGALLLINEGFQNVYQLRGGILGYLTKTSGAGFEGRCFVFDERESLDRRLEPHQC